MAEYKVNYTQSNFTGGLIATGLYGRNDFGKVKTGLKQCSNWKINETGGLEFRHGTKFLKSIPSSFGSDYKIASLGSQIVLFTSTDIQLYNSATNTFSSLSYVTDNIPSMDTLGFIELKRKLYYWDGIIKLCEVRYNTGETALETGITTFEGNMPTGSAISIATGGTPPSPSILIPYTYGVCIAKDADHIGIPIYSNTVSANSELGDQYIDVSITLPSDTALTGQRLFIYKKYQGIFYYLTSIDLVTGTDSYTYSDKGEYSVDTSISAKEQPSYLNSDGSISAVDSMADYGQRVFFTINDNITNIIFTQVGNTESVAYSKIRNEDEGGSLNIPVSHFDGWSRVFSGLDLIFSTKYTLSQIQGYGDLQIQTILFDGFSKNVNPVTTGRSCIYTNSNNKNIYDLTYNEYGQYDAIDLTLLVKQIFEDKIIKRIAYKDFPVKTVYVLCEDGDLFGLTYIKDQNVYAWYKIQHYGTVKDILVINQDTEDNIFLIVDNGTEDILEIAYNSDQDIYMDSCITIDNYNIYNNVITGLDHLEGQKVRVFDLGNNKYYGDYDMSKTKTIEQGGKVIYIEDLDFNGFEVIDGEIVLPSDISLEGDVIVGIPYYAVAENIPLDFSDSNGNSTIGRNRTINKAYLRYGYSRGLSYKTLGKEYESKILESDESDNSESLERGQISLNVDSEMKWDSAIKILQRQPYPARIESITITQTFAELNT